VRSLKAQLSSSNLLLLNVEDILGFAQIRAGKFNKNSKMFNISKSIEDIMTIQMYKAESQNIKLISEFIGFPFKEDLKGKRVTNYNILSDETRIQQVLLNL
jgi:signal transduction histidine kinase